MMVYHSMLMLLSMSGYGERKILLI